MSNSLLVGISGLRSHQEMLQVIGNNLANVDTTGFKASRVHFADLVYQQVKEATSGTTGVLGSVNPVSYGSGARVSQIDRDLAQGNLQQTGRELDMAIEGSGYFVLQRTDGPVYTRAGVFGIANNGTVVDPATGAPLQRVGDVGEPNGSDPGFQVNGDNRIFVPLGDRIGGQQTTELRLSGTLPRESTASVANVVASESPFQAAGVNATAATLLSDLDINVVDYGAGDQIRLSGTDVDGTPVNELIPVDENTTLGALVNELDSAFPEADIVLSNGRIVATAQDAGFSQLAMRIDDNSLDSGTGRSLFSNNQLVDSVEGTEATSISFSATQVFDVRGSAFTIDLNLTKQSDGSWTMVGSVDPSVGTLTDNIVESIRFADDGTLVQFGGTEDGDSRFVLTLNDAQADQVIDLDFGEIGTLSGISQTGDSFSTPLAEADGYTSGVFDSVSIDSDGKMFGIADNGVKFPLAQLAIASFRNSNGLRGIGDNHYRESLASGSALIGSAESGGRGSVRPGQLENSNVDLTAEFTRLIIAQRGFSANARTVTVTDEVLQELTNIIR